MNRSVLFSVVHNLKKYFFSLVVFFSAALSSAANLKSNKSGLDLNGDFFGFKTLMQTADRPEQAEVIIIGDFHGESGYDGHMIRALEIIQKLGEDDSILLLEGFGDQQVSLDLPTPILYQLHLHLPDEFRVYGWDEPRLGRSIGAMMQSEGTLARSESMQVDWALMNETVMHFIVEHRNRKMINTIKQHLDSSPMKKIFVTVGTMHLEDEELLDFLKNSDFKTVVYQNQTSLPLAQEQEERQVARRQATFKKALLEPNPEYDQESLKQIKQKMIDQVLDDLGLEPLPKPTLWVNPMGTLGQPIRLSGR